MPVKIGQRFVLRGSLAQVVLSYAVSEPGEWTAQKIAEDIEIRVSTISENVRSLERRGMIISKAKLTSIHPTDRGRDVLRRSMQK